LLRAPRAGTVVGVASAEPTTSPRNGARGGGAGIFVGFAPWIVFDVVASPSTWEFAAVAALITAAVLAGPDLLAGRAMLLDVAGIVFFAVMVLAALVLDRSDLDWLERYAQVISSGALAVIAFGSLAYVPFTEQYARRGAPRAVWSTPTFKQVNRLLTALWGLVFAAIAIMGWIAMHVDHGQDWLNWIIPIALLVGAIKFSAWYPEQVRGRAAARSRVTSRTPSGGQRAR
jgi:hypothetical protein